MDDIKDLVTQSATRLFAGAGTLDIRTTGCREPLDRALWDELEASGFVNALAGAEGGTFLAATPEAIRVAADHAAPVPLAETLLAAYLLRYAGLDQPEGVLTVAPVTAGDRLEWNANGADWILTGDARRVPFGGTRPTGSWSSHPKAVRRAATASV
ncbi:hypothetical protein GCM10011534_42910 [Pseudooceanicola nanhaiensis]|jgi:hypothetical protein|uniref:Acyl-CoA dehydrogenase/oxidase N-terminal domain-containing protein n=1 Tax=Pseudooceanicola nanhaiensis TaxID=375761 RepID=A0A917TBA0_9RHOB|nr:hypothetical protein [Pseudooceanicola nanhaiensis]GGM16413.1 hypothetical protein GCM10011534_42910 [Pseudooceanicola nanhaiensis]